MDKMISVDFFSSLYQNCEDGFVNLRGLPSGASVFFPLSDVDKISGWVERHENENLFFAVALRQNEDGSKHGIGQIPALWVDLDTEGISTEKGKQLREAWENFPLKPTITVRSGGGRHSYWRLKEPGTRGDIAAHENYLKRLTSHLMGDPNATDASRILRVPGTLNYKYTPPRRVEVVEINDWEYDLSDFDFLPEIQKSDKEKPPQSEEWVKKLLGEIKEGERNTSIARLAGRCFTKSLSWDETLLLCHAANSRYLPPLPDQEVVTTVHSVWKTHQRNNTTKGINLKLTTLADVFEYTEPCYLINPIVIEGTVNVLGAYTGVGKSMVTLSVIKSLLTGGSLWGKYPVTKTGPVLLVDEETPNSFLRDRVEKMGFNKNLPLHFLHFQNVKLDQDNCFNALMEKVEEVRPILVAVDSLIRVHRQKEDEAVAMAKVGDALRKIANLGTTLWLIHHHKKGEGPLPQKLRGSSDIPAMVDVGYALVPKDDYLIFSSVKTRTRPVAPIKLKMEIDDHRAEVRYRGAETGKKGEILSEVIAILKKKDGAGVGEIHEALKQCGIGVGTNALRDILNQHVGKELIEECRSRGKKVYRLAVSQLHPPIYTGEAVKVVSSRGSSFTDNPSIPPGGSEGQSLDSQGIDTSFTASPESLRETGKAVVKERPIGFPSDPGSNPDFESSSSESHPDVRLNQPKYKVGDSIQWVSQGAEQFDRPEKIVRVDRDLKSGEWFYFIETTTTTTAFPESQVELVEEGR